MFLTFQVIKVQTEALIIVWKAKQWSFADILSSQEQFQGPDNGLGSCFWFNVLGKSLYIHVRKQDNACSEHPAMGTHLYVIREFKYNQFV